jgi:hypothetical protein
MEIILIAASSAFAVVSWLIASQLMTERHRPFYDRLFGFGVAVASTVIGIMSLNMVPYEPVFDVRIGITTGIVGWQILVGAGGLATWREMAAA